jgi:DNA-binding response OmpR family regulator
MNNAQKKIFVADDDADILEVIEMILKTDGYTVDVTKNAKEIFTQVQENLPDLILLDIWMSGVDGREICEQLKKNELTKNIPVLFISANSNIVDITNEYSADGYVRKPFDMAALLKKVKDIINRN